LLLFLLVHLSYVPNFFLVVSPSIRLSLFIHLPPVGLEQLERLKKGKGRSYSITERRVPEMIPVLGSQPAGDVSHKPGGRLPLLSARRPAVTPQPLRGLLPILLLGEQRHNGCEQFA